MKLSYTYNEIKSSILDAINNDSELRKIYNINLNIVGKLRAIIEAVARGIYEFVGDSMITIYNNIYHFFII